MKVFGYFDDWNSIFYNWFINLKWYLQGLLFLLFMIIIFFIINRIMWRIHANP